MQYSKTPKAGEYTIISQFVTIQELEDMKAFIRNFKYKYTRKKVASVKKRISKY